MGRKGSSDRKRAATLTPEEAFEEARNRIAKLPKHANRLDLSGLKRLREIPNEIETLTELDTLEIRGTQIGSLAVVAGLPRLRILQAPSCPISSIKPLAKCEALEVLDLAGTLVTDLSPVADHPLTHLSLDRTGIDEIEPYAFFESLVYINVERSRLRNLASLRKARQLAVLVAEKTPIDDLSPLEHAKGLMHLNVSETKVDSLEALAGTVRLERLDASDTLINDIGPLAKLAALNWLNINNTDVHDLSPISGLKNVTRLEMRETRVRSLRPIAGYKQLQYLSISNTDIDDINVVAHMISLIPDQIGDLRGWPGSGFGYRSTPAARRSPFARLLGRSYDGTIETVETINYLRRAQGLPEKYPEGYARADEVEEFLRQLDGVENDSEILRQRPATFGFALRNGKIVAEPRTLAPSNQLLAGEIHASVVPKITSARERFARSNAPVRIQKSIDEVARMLGNEIGDVEAGALLMGYRSVEADCAAYNTPSGRRELPEDALAILLDVASSLEDLMGCYPGLAEIEAERLAQRVQNADVPRLMELMAAMSKDAAKSEYVSQSAVEALHAGQDAVDQLTEAIGTVRSSHSEIAHAIQARSKLVGQKLLDYRNFVASALRHAGSGIGRSAIATASGLGKVGKETLKEVGNRAPKAIGKGVARGLEKSSEAAVKIGLAALVSSIAGAVAGVGILVASFTPLGTKAAELEEAAEESNEKSKGGTKT